MPMTPEEVASLWSGPGGSHNPIQWDGQGRPYYPSARGPHYLAPIEAAQTHDPRAVAWAKSKGADLNTGSTGAPSGGFTGNSTWNSDTGEYEKDNFFDSSLGGLVLGGSMMAAPLAAGAFGGGAAAEAEGLAGSSVLGGGATGAGLSSSTIGSGFIPAIAGGTGMPAGAGGAAAGLGATDWLGIAGDVGQALGANSAGRAEGRNLDNIANIGFANAQNNLYNSELAAPQKIASNAVRGDILSNARDVSIALPEGSQIPMPTISGGLRPSMFSDTTRQLGKSITANAAATPMPTPTPPVLQPMETSGAYDDILNTAGLVGNIAKAVPSNLWGKIGSGLKGLF